MCGVVPKIPMRILRHPAWPGPRDCKLPSHTSSSASAARDSLNVMDQPTRRASASGSISRAAPQSQMTRTKELAEAIVQFLDVSEHGARAHGADGWPGRPCSCWRVAVLDV